MMEQVPRRNGVAKLINHTLLYSLLWALSKPCCWWYCERMQIDEVMLRSCAQNIQINQKVTQKRFFVSETKSRNCKGHTRIQGVVFHNNQWRLSPYFSERSLQNSLLWSSWFGCGGDHRSFWAAWLPDLLKFRRLFGRGQDFEAELDFVCGFYAKDVKKLDL